MVALKGIRLAASAALLAASSALSATQSSPLARLTHDADIAEMLGQLRDEAPAGLLKIEDVQIVDPAKETVTPHSTIIVQGARIVWTGSMAKAPQVPQAVRIDGHGRFAVPGLSDMHVHSSRADGWLLNLAAGVTTVRDMDGFPWLLRVRDRINAGKMLGPTDYVAGTIIAGAPLDGYAVVVASPADARRVVRQQAACGYDFIKVHNVLSQPELDAVAEQALALGMDLVGHVPHDISLDHALHVDRMRTTEHLKGFLNDRDLLPNNEDYAAALANARTWVTPTLYTRRGYERGDWARAFLASPLARFAPPDARARWAKLIAQPDGHDLMMGERFRNTQDVVMKRLVPLHPHWLTGTDAEGYAFNLTGFGLLDELQLMQSYGLSAAEVLRASTVEAADAMHETGEFGLIVKGYRADLILLDNNPLVSVAAFDANQGVMVRGRWLDRPTLDKALARLAAIYADGRPVPSLSAANAKALIERITKLHNDGFVFDDGALALFAQTLRKWHLGVSAVAVERLQAARTGDLCYVPPPTD